MAEPTDSRKLSGLARSIDSLFAAPAAPVPVATRTLEETPPPSPPEADPPAATLVAPPPFPPPDHEPFVAAPRRTDMFPATQMVEAIEGPPPAVAEPAPTVLDVPESEWSAPPTADEAALDLSVPPSETASGEVPHGPDASGFAREVDAYLGGDASARARAERLAVDLKERFDLDPLADAVEKVVRAAGDPPDTEYLEFAGAVINPAVASRLVQRLGQAGDEVRRQEYFAISRRLGRVMANALKGALTGALEKSVRRTYYDALICMGDSVRPMIEGMVADDNRFLVRDGVAILGEIGGPRAVEVVTSALADNDPRVRVEALQALGKLGDAKVGQLVLGFLDDTNSSVRLAAADAAGRLGLERALRHVVRMLDESKDPDEIVALLSALAQIGDPGAVPAIEKHAVPSLRSKPTTEVRVAAYRALHAIGSPHARELVRQTQQDKDPAVRFALRDLAAKA